MENDVEDDPACQKCGCPYPGDGACWKAATKHRLDILQEAWDAINANIIPGEVQGNGCDETAQRNGMILASNILYGLIHKPT